MINFPLGDMTSRHLDRGLYCVICYYFGNFKKGYEETYGKPYIDKRSVIDKTGKNHYSYGKPVRTGEKTPNWKGGVTPFRIRLRSIKEYFHWKHKVLKRDNYTCQMCGLKTAKLHAHHIKKFSVIIEEYKIDTIEKALNCKELWFEDNGISLCEKCHRKEHWGV